MEGYIYRQSIKDRAIAEAALALANVTGQSATVWRNILRWRVRYFHGNLNKALAAQGVFAWPE